MMNLGTQNVLVTGAAGWIGTALVNALIHGSPDSPALATPDPHLKIRALLLPGDDDEKLRKMSDRVEIVRGDVRNAADCDKFCAPGGGGVVFHLAGIIHPQRVREFYDINVTGSGHVLEAAARAKVRRVVVMSSNSPCGNNPNRDDLFDEQSPYHPYRNYGRSKMLLELKAREFHKAGLVETSIIRAPWFYGPFQPPRQTLFFNMIRDGKGPIVGDGNNRRSMAYVENLAQGLLLAAAAPAAGGKIYWIADRYPYTMNQIIDTVEKLLETEFGQKCAHKRMKLPGVAAEIAGVADAMIQQLGGYNQKIHVLSEMNKTIACRVDRAVAELGYNPAVDLEEGMRRSLRWVREQGMI
ncbi:MAG: NAD(P)-dependent oxidoreductase [Tepidisphaeraceae bacterium]|jgi:nucleoside-diphosphate-sugar epimerase